MGTGSHSYISQMWSQRITGQKGRFASMSCRSAEERRDTANEKGTYIHETVRSVLATRAQQGLNSLEMLRLSVEWLNMYEKLI